MDYAENLRLLQDDLKDAHVFYSNQQYSFVLPTLKSLWARAIHNELCGTQTGLDCGLKLAACLYQLGDFIESHQTLSAVKKHCGTQNPEVLLCEIFALNDFGEFETASMRAAELEEQFENLQGDEKSLQYESKTIHREKFAATLIESGQAREAIAILGSILRSKHERNSSLKLKLKALIELKDWDAAGDVIERLEELEDPVSKETKELAAIVRINCGGPTIEENDPHPSTLEKQIASIQGLDT